MGRLPATWANRLITEREPYELYGELFLAASTPGFQFPDTTFSNNVNKPFEIHRMIPRVYGADSSNVIVFDSGVNMPTESLMAALVKLKITDIGLDYVMTKNPTRIDVMVKGSSERTWEFADPHYLVTSNQIQVVCDVDAFPAGFTDLEIAKLLIAITFQGFLLTVAPPGENR